MIAWKRWLAAALLATAPLMSAPTACRSESNPYDDAIKKVRLLSESPRVRLLQFGKSHSGRLIPAFVLSDFTRAPGDKRRILILAGQHGDEPAPVASLLSLCRRWTSDADVELLARSVILVIPAANPDGLAARRRMNAQGIDLNRDWSAFATDETRFANAIIKAWRPHLLIDVHEWTDMGPTHDDAIETPECRIAPQQEACDRLASRLAAAAGLRLARSAGGDASMFHRHYGALGYTAYLIETAPGFGSGHKDHTYTTALTAAANAVADDALLAARLSPASSAFDPAMVSTYLETPGRPLANPWSFPVAALLGAYGLLIWVLKPTAQRQQPGWSRRFTRCLVEPGVRLEPLAARHLPQPLTARSWINRRLRARYAAARR